MCSNIFRTSFSSLPCLVAISVWLCTITNVYALSPIDTLHISNDVRARGCGKHAGVQAPLTLQQALSTAARRMERANQMRDALQRVGYRADRSATLHIGGRIDAAAFKLALQEHYCELITDRAFSEIGISIDDRGVWVILATPFAPPATGDANKVANRVLQLVNAARVKPRRCGSKKFVAVPPLEMNETLARAAYTHAKDMAAHDSVEHEGSDGSSPADRATGAGYRWKSVGENVAGGQLTAEEVVSGWLASPGHCSNIMDKDFTQMGVAYVVNRAKHIGIYWAQEFGQPR